MYVVGVGFSFKDTWMFTLFTSCPGILAFVCFSVKRAKRDEIAIRARATFA